MNRKLQDVINETKPDHNRVYNIDDPDLPESLHEVRKVFSKPQPPKNDRGRNETLHDYFTRHKLKCFCRECRAKIKAAEAEKQQGLL